MKKIVVTLFAVLASPLAQATDGYFSHGYGIKSKGMGGVGVALPQDALAAATNPAGMVAIGDRIDFGLDWFKPNRGSEFVGNTAGLAGTYTANDTSNFFIPEFGYNKLINPDMSVGVSVYGNGGMNTDYSKSPLASWGVSGSTGINLEQLFIAPTFAMKLNPGNSIGVSLNLAYQAFEAKGLDPFMGWSSDKSFVTNTGKDSSTGYGMRVGWAGNISPAVTLGATYQTKTKMGKFDKYKGLFAGQGGFDIPANYAVGIAAKVTDTTTVALDVEQIEYSKVASIANSLASPGSLGANNGKGFGWRDLTAIKLGVSHQYNSGLVVRAGYNTARQPIPQSETLFNFVAPGVVENHLTLGATMTLANKSEVTVGYMHAFKKTVSGSNSISPGAPPAGMGGGNVNLDMYQDSLGIAYGWKM